MGRADDRDDLSRDGAEANGAHCPATPSRKQNLATVELSGLHACELHFCFPSKLLPAFTLSWRWHCGGALTPAWPLAGLER
mmetsp:Transcript_64/g.174  ORF Transcript_64/g.174 Transcript_64/m.174 type:complete len:81 (-) Transcript_64:351-593(-)